MDIEQNFKNLEAAGIDLSPEKNDFLPVYPPIYSLDSTFDPENIVLLCYACHGSLHSKDQRAWIVENKLDAVQRVKHEIRPVHAQDVRLMITCLTERLSQTQEVKK